MAKLECQFFPGSPALWTCPECDTLYGERCIPAGHSQHWGRNDPACIRCTKQLSYLGNATDAKPFWQQLHHFFAYPLQNQPLIVAGLLTLINLFIDGSLISLALYWFSMAVLIKYGFAIITERGQGNRIAHTLSQVLSNDPDHLFLRQTVMMIAMGAVVYFASDVNQTLGLLVMGFITLALPASIMVLAVEKSVRCALNPMALISFMMIIGWPYLLLWFCSQAITVGPYILSDFFIGSGKDQAPPGIFTLIALNFLMFYFSIVLYTMLGYVLFEYQHELGYNTVIDDDNDLNEKDFIKARALGEVAVFISDQKYPEARQCLRQALDAVHNDIELHSRYHKLLMLLDDTEALANHAEYLVSVLMAEQQVARAVGVVLDAQSRLATFKISKTDTAVAIAQLMVEQGHYRNVVRLFHNFHKHQPNDPLLPAAYLLVAKTLIEHLGDDKTGNAIARYTLTKNPNYKERAELEKLIAFSVKTKT
ncbi:tetratricopeptide repeat protein [Gilvimarinus polysaccharolyticus]|uniref:tetratricopeptide repeat protein n=1 Tax=Gilvimarinus polysaccharolyticus TaxID=863921 RepID=UPI0006737760|nr:hypothetical protein [Gilvimarinus polysaccharolyticus]